MLEVFMTYSEESDLEKVDNEFKSLFTFIDSLSRKGKREAWLLKSHWAARLDPFALIKEDEIPIKAFYSESENVIDNLNLYLHERKSQGIDLSTT